MHARGFTTSSLRAKCVMSHSVMFYIVGDETNTLASWSHTVNYRTQKHSMLSILTWLADHFPGFGCDDASDWLLVEGGETCAMFADVSIRNDAAAPSLQHRMSPAALSKLPDVLQPQSSWSYLTRRADEHLVDANWRSPLDWKGSETCQLFTGMR